MSSNNSNDDPGYNIDNELDMDLDLESKSEDTPVSAGTRSKSEREETRAPPGPACSKAEFKSRSRSSSAASERRSRRRAVFDENRASTVASDSDRGGDDSSTVILSDDQGAYTDEEFYRPSGSREPSLKRKAGSVELLDGSQCKQGRPQTTGYYVGRAEVIERVNLLKREEAKLNQEKVLMNLSAGQIFSSIENEIEDAVEMLQFNPTADVAQEIRQNMSEVVRVARISSNLKGGMKKILKHAAVIGAASAEVLRTRADRDKADSDALRQVKALKKELEASKQEALSAKKEAEVARKEAEALREELVEVGARQRRGGGRRRVIVDDDDSPPQSPAGRRTYGITMEEPLAMAPADEDPTMDVEEAGTGTTEIPEYSDERRRKELLPPGEKLPPVLRPALQGRVKILEDRKLDGHKVRMVDKRTRAPPTRESAEGGTQREILASLMERLTPLLEGWLRESLRSMGLPNTNGGSDRPTSKDGKEGKGRKDLTPPEKTKTGGPGAKKGGERATSAHNNIPKSAVVERKESDSHHPPQPPRAAQDPAEVWTEVKGKRMKKRKPSSSDKTQPSPADRKQGGGMQPRKGDAPKRDGQQKATLKRKPPRSAAVTLTCPPGTYADVMRKAREKINLEEIGIQSLRPKKAATGALILEVPGPNGAERAEVLRERMEAALLGMEGVKVARPVKQGEARVKDIEESITLQDVREAVSKAGQCKQGEIQTGEFRTAPNGLSTLWIRGPLTAINKVVTAGRIRLGWTASRVVALEPRQLQCHKCLEAGHVQGMCPNTADRRNLCYRCSQEGHVAKACVNAPRCVLCEEAGRQSSHRVGGPACKAPKKKAGPPKRVHPPSTTRTEGERMEVEIESQPAVRGGSPRETSEGAPVPVRLGSQETAVEAMEVEMDPAPSQPPMEKRIPRTKKGKEVPVKSTPSPQ